ncbi:hypothetical protein Hypma_000992 [Hypsizygus marmoreus]|uniref:NAD(P)-binding domain-containing protein n=1 Tax=Hypsizygus marmoreus TaxID=39966 RepID=A0A369J6C6_HYPMA|nr:hypothetical protein Hypma_000992 [Hypsizygus marmoreus]
MKLLILGSTGPTGILLIRQALQDIPDVKIILYVRSPQKIPADLSSNPAITIITGQLTDTETFSKAFEGVDAVVSALGPVGYSHPSDTPIAAAFAETFEQMRKHGVRRLVALSTASIHDPLDKFSLSVSSLVFGVKVFMRGAYNDVVKTGENTKELGGDLDWTIVRVPILTNVDSTDVVAGYIGDGKTGVKLSRKGFAKFAIDELTKREWVQKMPYLSSP